MKYPVVITLVILIGWVFLLFGKNMFHRQVEQLPVKYHLGMTIDEAKSLMSKPYEVSPSAIAYERPGPTPEQLKNDVWYIIEVKDEHLTLRFNYDKRLIGK